MKMITTRFRAIAFNSLGITLIETVVALAIFASAGAAVLLGVSTAHRSSAVVDASSVAENLARNQMEYVWTLEYIAPGNLYDSLALSDLNIDIPSGFDVSAAAVEIEELIHRNPGCIQKVVVTVTRNDEDYHVLETLRSTDSLTCPK